MSVRSRIILTALAAAAVLALLIFLVSTNPARDRASLPRYEITELAPAELGNAMACNNAGQVVGYNGTGAFIWDKAARRTALGTLGGRNSMATCINQSGQVAGSSETANGQNHAFIWDRTGGMVDLGTLGGRNSYAQAINDAGQVVGSAETAAGQLHAFFWDSSTGMIDLGALSSNPQAYSAAYDVSNSGKVAGMAAGHAFVWDKINGMVDLGTFGGTYSCALAVNDAGQVAGVSQTGRTEYRVFLWNDANSWGDLGTIDKGAVGVVALNEAGQLIGTLDPLNMFFGRRYSFLWSEDTGFIILDDLLPRGSGWKSLTTAVDLNDRGQILGLGHTTDGQYRVFLMTPAAPSADQ